AETQLDDEPLRKDNNSAVLLETLRQQLTSLQTPSVISSENKNNWVLHCAWAIQNLVKYNQISQENLLTYAMNHLLDILTFNEKVILLSYLTTKEAGAAELDDLDRYIQAYFEQFKISGGRYNGIVLSQFNKPSDYEQYTILNNVDDKWVNNKRAVAGGLAQAMFQKFQLTDMKIINDIIGFMINFKGSQIVFKTKYIKQSAKGRSNKGQRCDRGEGKKIVIRRINMLLGSHGGKEKYEIAKKYKSSISFIYG
ncbi:unnamed protein product, partial [marine sediment metagenome]